MSHNLVINKSSLLPGFFSLYTFFPLKCNLLISNILSLSLVFADLTLFVVVILLSVAHGAPHRQRNRRHHQYLSAHEPQPLRLMEWVNPCKIQAPQVSHLNSTETIEPPCPPSPQPKNVSFSSHFSLSTTNLRAISYIFSRKDINHFVSFLPFDNYRKRHWKRWKTFSRLKFRASTIQTWRLSIQMISALGSLKMAPTNSSDKLIPIK